MGATAGPGTRAIMRRAPRSAIRRLVRRARRGVKALGHEKALDGRDPRFERVKRTRLTKARRHRVDHLLPLRFADPPVKAGIRQDLDPALKPTDEDEDGCTAARAEELLSQEERLGILLYRRVPARLAQKQSREWWNEDRDQRERRRRAQDADSVTQCGRRRYPLVEPH